MKSFPAQYQPKPQDRQMAKELCDSLGCKDVLTVSFVCVLFQAIKVFDWKQSQYGCGNIARAGAKGVVTRLGDKVSRLENLTAKDEEPVDEPIEDSFGDSGNYGFIGLMCRWGLWPGVKAGG